MNILRTLTTIAVISLSFYGGWQVRGGFEAVKSNPFNFAINLIQGK
jgi:hypothetical protein